MEKMVTKNIDEILTREELKTLEIFGKGVQETDERLVIAEKSYARGFLSAMELVKSRFENVPGEIFMEKLRSEIAKVFGFENYEEMKNVEYTKALGIEESEEE